MVQTTPCVVFTLYAGVTVSVVVNKETDDIVTAIGSDGCSIRMAKLCA
jgi:hypothetical protein